VPGVEFHVAGHKMSAALRELCGRQGIVAHGYVEDLFEIVAASGLYVAPMVAGGGVKNKIMEAMAVGVPVVTNIMGAEALPPAARQIVAVHDDPQAFADYIRDLVADPARSCALRRKTRLAAEHCFDWRHRRAEFVNLMTEAVTASEAGVHAATA
jgi:glycosyltransferase involved in cell wall biosynthesis